ncbi:MAG TPA: electron transport complex subunit RsxC [Candidatus Pelethocola excrementipullorum]|nr:electron transport complex subunit RsxC [Candidatus Pelethocola excrementipullorum]
MGFLTFQGGIHPDDGKELSKNQKIATMEAGDKLYYSVAQHIGAPAIPVVAKGDYVMRGQLLAKAGGFVSAPVHASVSGTVAGIQKMRMPGGGLTDCIVVENDGEMKELSYEGASSLEDLSKEEILSRISNAGIVGMGGAGFPTHVKLSPKEPEKIEYILVNGAECEPYLTSDYRRMLEEPERVVEGLRVVLKLFPKAKGYICIEDNKKDCVKAIEPLCTDSNIEVRILRTKYPQGAERMLIHATTGRRINSSMLPADVGCIVDNIDTITAIGQAVLKGEPLMERIMTITGDAISKPQNLLVPIGTLMGEVVDVAGGFKQDPEKIIAGGPMMGNALFGLDVPVIKTSSAILAFTKDEVSASQPSACINCGRCVEDCPGRVVPARLATFADRGDEESFLKYDGMECCECGCCSYVCPAKRQLTQSIRSMRKILLSKRKKG